ncbi:MAG: 16S rRNA processing protein RimM [Tindallia sp. MSAO_Bac2]|nr:MAG: 16S rRNA processing protein RimM [Tindallia sp. MSAO_Bac2]
MRFLKVGVVSNTHGVRGALKVQCLADEAERFLELEWVYTLEPEKRYKILNVSIRPKDILLFLEGIDTMNQAEEMKGKFLYTDDTQRSALEEDQHYIADLIGLKVYDIEDTYIGTVKQVMPTGANDILVIQSEDGTKEHMVPNVREFVREISPEKEIIIIDPVEGLIT